MKKLLKKCLIAIYLGLTTILMLTFCVGCDILSQKHVDVKTIKVVNGEFIVVYTDNVEKNLGTIAGIKAYADCKETHDWKDYSKVIYKTDECFECEKLTLNGKVCSNCGKILTASILSLTTHEGGTATCTKKANCIHCHRDYGDFKSHEYNILKYDAENHWYECECGAYETKENHNPGAEATETTDQKCTECDYVITPALGHVHTLHLTKVDAKPQSCTKEGNIEYYTCSCSKWFTTNTATTEITDKDSVVIEKDAHNYNTLKNNEVEHWYECTCGDKKDVEAHKGGTATEENKPICDVCGSEYGSILEHTHSFIVQKIDDAYIKATAKCESKAEYYYSCACGEKGSEYFEYGDELSHSYGDWVSNGNGTHTKTCVYDSSHNVTENCAGGTATCQVKATCETCDGEYSDLKDHEYNTLKKSDTEHWYECTCGDRSEIEEHYNVNLFCNDVGICEVCSANFTTKKHKIGTIILEENTPNTAYDLRLFRQIERTHPGCIKFKDGVSDSIESTHCGTILEATIFCDLCLDTNKDGISIYFKANGSEPLHKICCDNTDYWFAHGETYKFDANIDTLIKAGLLTIIGSNSDILSATKDMPIMLCNENTACCKEMLIIYVYNQL